VATASVWVWIIANGWDLATSAPVCYQAVSPISRSGEPHVRLSDNAWAEFVPFLAFDPEIRRVICSTNAIESVNARIRRAVKAGGHFSNE
jgi:hypothetical protein